MPTFGHRHPEDEAGFGHSRRSRVVVSCVGQSCLRKDVKLKVKNDGSDRHTSIHAGYEFCDPPVSEPFSLNSLSIRKQR